jgi:SAM-dependent methyltransferase
MDASSHLRASLRCTITEWWRHRSARVGTSVAIRELTRELWGFLRDSTPERRRQRYGDVDYDWDFRVNTTSATVGWRDRLMGIFHSPYQPTEPALFREMMAQLPSGLSRFVFVDLGSGKGRVLLMASDYPFRRIVGVELLPELDRVAQENIRQYKSPSQRCATIEAICADARGFEFPDDPLVLYLFNPLPEDGLMQVMESLSRSLEQNPREVWVVYHNPILERVLASNLVLERVSGTTQYVLYRSVAAS